jgi:hypothetical protein
MKTLMITCLFALTCSIALANEAIDRSFLSADVQQPVSSTALAISKGGESDEDVLDQQDPDKKKEAVKSVPETKAKSKPEKISRPSARNSRARSGRSSTARSNRSNSSSRGRGH